MRSRSIHSFLIVTAFIICTTVTSISGQPLLKSSKYVPGPFEVSIGITQMPIYPADASFIKMKPTGLKLEAGFRPKFTNRHLLLEAFFQHISKARDKTNPVYHDRNQFNLFGIDATYLILNPKMRINPFVGVGYGRYVFRPMIYFYPDSPCSITNGCPAYFYNRKAFQNLILKSGLYVTVIPDFAIKGEVSLFKHLGSFYNDTGIDESKLAPSLEVSLRF